MLQIYYNIKKPTDKKQIGRFLAFSFEFEFELQDIPC